MGLGMGAKGITLRRPNAEVQGLRAPWWLDRAEEKANLDAGVFANESQPSAIRTKEISTG